LANRQEIEPTKSRSNRRFGLCSRMVADLALPPSLLSPADTALLETDLVTGDPESRTTRLRLTTTVPPEILQRYNVAPPKGEERPYVWCAHCSKPTHWKGYVVKLATDELVNLGHDCGRQQFGFEFGTVENEFNALVERQALLRRLVKIRRVAPEVSKLVRALSYSEETLAFDDARAGLLSTWPVLWRALRSASGTGRLITQVLVADPEEAARQKASIRRYHEKQMAGAPTKTARERVRKEMQAALNDVGEVKREVTTDHGPLHGANFLQLQGSLESGWQDAHQRARLVCQTAETVSGQLSIPALRKLSRDTAELLDQISRLADCHSSCEAFWQPENLTRIVSWWAATGEAAPTLRKAASGLTDEKGASVASGAARRLPAALDRLQGLTTDLDGRQ